MNSEINIKSSIQVSINGIDLTLTRDQAINLRDALNKELGDQWNWPPQPSHPPIQPYYPKDNDWPIAPTTPTYPSWPQIWCGMSMFPKESVPITQTNCTLFSK